MAAVYLTCVGPAGAVWDHEEPDDPDYGNGGPTKLYLNEQPMISAFDVGSRYYISCTLFTSNKIQKFYLYKVQST